MYTIIGEIEHSWGDSSSYLKYVLRAYTAEVDISTTGTKHINHALN
jgi:hypothetical protein